MCRKNPLVSVIIPNYNNGRYLKQCLDSIAMQTYQPIETVIVDDVSTDDSREIITALSGHYDRLLIHFLEENGGVSNARNVGAALSSGAYLCFLDPDDFFYADDKIENEMALILSHLEKGEKVMAYSGVACVNEAGEYVETRGLTGQIEGHMLPAYVARYKEDRHPRNEIMDREVFLDLTGGFDTSMSLWEDSDLFIRALMYRDIYFTGKMGTAYRWKEGGLSHIASERGESIQRDFEKRYYAQFSVKDKLLYRWYKFLRIFYNFRRIKLPVILNRGSRIKHKIIRR